MEFTELQKNVSSLNLKDRRKLMAYLVSLEDDRDQQYKETLSRKIDDDNPEQWHSADKHLKILDVHFADKAQ